MRRKKLEESAAAVVLLARSPDGRLRQFASLSFSLSILSPLSYLQSSMSSA